jgi:hypothetical protein
VIEVGGLTTPERSAAPWPHGGHPALIGGAGGYDGNGNPMARALEVRALRPAIDYEIAFESAPSAYADLQGGGHVGEVVIHLR